MPEQQEQFKHPTDYRPPAPPEIPSPEAEIGKIPARPDQIEVELESLSQEQMQRSAAGIGHVEAGLQTESVSANLLYDLKDLEFRVQQIGKDPKTSIAGSTEAQDLVYIANKQGQDAGRENLEIK